MIRLALTLTALLLSACAPKRTGDGVDSAPADSDADTDADTDTDTDADTEPAPAPDDYTTAHGSEMTGIGAGTFTMGSGASDPTGDYQDHDVTLTHAFWIGKTELTLSEWAFFTAATTAGNYLVNCVDDCPVNAVSWYDATTYCNALSTAEGLTPCYKADGTDLKAAYVADPYSCPGYRLPTEAEWEYAARADRDQEWSGSNDSTRVAWTSENADSTAHDACGLATNAWGLCDMSGNVEEWVNDGYDGNYGGYRDGTAQTDPPGPSSASNRVFRGGNWHDLADGEPVSCRSEIPPDVSGDGRIGFRVARTSP